MHREFGPLWGLTQLSIIPGSSFWFWRHGKESFYQDFGFLGVCPGFVSACGQLGDLCCSFPFLSIFGCLLDILGVVEEVLLVVSLLSVDCIVE